MGPLILAKNFTIAMHDLQTFFGDWMGMDSQFQNGTIHVHCQTLTPTGGLTNGIAVEVETSYDTVENNQIGATVNVTATGSQSAPISSNIAPMIRLKLENTENLPMFATLSVWLQPKSD